MESTRKISCPICSSKNTKFKFTGHDYYEKLVNKNFELYQCQNCDCVFIHPMPIDKEISSFYPNNYYSYSVEPKTSKSFFDNVRENTIRANFEGLNSFNLLWRIILFFTKHKFKDLLPCEKKVGGRFLDIGCGNAKNLEILKMYGWQTHGIEINNSAVINAQKRNLNVSFTTLENYKTKNKFNAIRLWHVLEHLPNPHEAIKKIYNILENDGVIYIGLPNIKSLNAIIFGKYWIGYDVPRHLINYAPSSFTSLMKQNKFKIVSFKYSSTNGLISSLSNFINKWTNKKYRLANNALLCILTYPYDLLTDLFKLGDIVYIKVKKL